MNNKKGNKMIIPSRVLKIDPKVKMQDDNKEMISRKRNISDVNKPNKTNGMFMVSGRQPNGRTSNQTSPKLKMLNARRAHNKSPVSKLIRTESDDYNEDSLESDIHSPTEYEDEEDDEMSDDQTYDGELDLNPGGESDDLSDNDFMDFTVDVRKQNPQYLKLLGPSVDQIIDSELTEVECNIDRIKSVQSRLTEKLHTKTAQLTSLKLELSQLQAALGYVAY